MREEHEYESNLADVIELFELHGPDALVARHRDLHRRAGEKARELAELSREHTQLVASLVESAQLLRMAGVDIHELANELRPPSLEDTVPIWGHTDAS